MAVDLGWTVHVAFRLNQAQVGEWKGGPSLHCVLSSFARAGPDRIWPLGHFRFKDFLKYFIFFETVMILLN
jgi:hypothetical protein